MQSGNVQHSVLEGIVQLPVLEKPRTTDALNSDASNKQRYAQYFTPDVVADYMVRMLDWTDGANRVLDPGAGEGALSLAVLRHLKKAGIKVPVYMVEIDQRVFNELKTKTESFSDTLLIRHINGDFIREAFKLREKGIGFSHVIMNPPYYKLQRNSEYSGFLMSCGVNATNIYAAFVWLSALLLDDGGQIVAIVPRSFCNGPYFLKFREFMTSGFSIDRIHSFSSRDSVFSKDQVLQENIIIRFSKCPQAEKVLITYSSDQSFSDTKNREFDSDSVISPNDPERTIRIPAYDSQVELTDIATKTLNDLGLSVSTGPVVDFRLKDAISKDSEDGSVPLLYPAHMIDGEISWPVDDLKKKGQYYRPQPSLWSESDHSAIVCDKNVSPAEGCYVVIRRFSSKEEKRRVYASVVDPAELCPKGVAFENHLNYYHVNKHGFSKELAIGLAAYLNSKILDEHFRTFSGHTQVNATDLRNLPYPGKEQLLSIGMTLLRGKRSCTHINCEELLEACA
jgi:adenine-specific DNA-methyltransferase